MIRCEHCDPSKIGCVCDRRQNCPFGFNKRIVSNGIKSQSMGYLEFLEKYCKDNGADFELTESTVRINLHGMIHRYNGSKDIKEVWAKETLNRLITLGSEKMNENFKMISCAR